MFEFSNEYMSALEAMEESLIKSSTPLPGRYYFLNEDSEENWNINKIKYADVCEKNYYSHTSIMYKINKLGHRNKLTPDPINEYNIYIGCSHTFGIGLPAGAIWHNHLTEWMNVPAYNAGIPGGSMSTCYRNLLALHAKGIKIRRLFILAPSFNRLEVFDSRWRPLDCLSNNHKAIKKTLLTDEYMMFDKQKSLQAIKGFCLDSNIEHVIVDVDEREIDHILCADRTARDFIHSGPEAHLKIAKVFYERYKKYYSST